MDNAPSSAPNDQSSGSPQPETLKPRTDASAVTTSPSSPTTPEVNKKLRTRSYRPSHKGTFIGLGAVAVILAINVGVLVFLLRKQAANEDQTNREQVTISAEDLNKLGINRGSLGSSGVELTVGPDAQFKGKVSIASDTSVGGQLILSGKVSGTNASFTQLQAGKTSLSELSVNGDSTLSDLTLRNDLAVTGKTQLQGPVTLSQLLTVNNSLNVSGNLSVGGVLAVNTFSVRNLGLRGHIITSGSAPAVGRGSATGSNGTVSISGNDTAGTIALNIGTGASGGILANVAFRSQYSNIPKVVISPVGIGGSFYVTNISVGGFSVGINSGLPAGGYRVNYIVMQ